MMEYQTPGGSLSNQDFKKLMMTPRRSSTEETPVPDYLARKRRKREGLRIDTAEVFARPQKKPEEAPPTYRRSAREARYRDRAEERRGGENPDYVDDNKMLREAGLPERKKELLSTPMYATPSKPPAALGGATPQYTPSYTPAPALAFSTPAPGQSTSVGGTTVTRLSSATPAQPSAAPAAAAAAVAAVVPDAVAEQRNREIREQIEKSKYLGGDVKHTHLVRGLDFALLQKVRQEIVLTEKEMEELRRKEKAKEEKEREAQPQAEQPRPFQTLIGERLHDTLFGWQTRKVDAFLPGRTFYVIDFDENASDVPITQYRPRHELDLGAEDQHNAGLPAALLEQVVAVCQDRQKGLYGPMKERKKREREKELQRQRDEEEKKKLQRALRQPDDRPKPRTSGIALPDEDIFPNAGEYRPDVGPDATHPHATTLAEASTGPLFRDLREAKLKEEKEAQLLQERLRAHAKAHVKAEAAGGAKGPVAAEDDPFSLNDIQLPAPKARPTAPAPTPAVRTAGRPGHLGPAPRGDYEECYPGAQHDDDGVYDDMHLKEKDVMDRGSKRKRRSDFATEEEWSQYNMNREALPKAAFQYQKKMDDGRTTRRAKHGQGGDSD
nr:Cytokine IK [Euglena gracilis]